MVEVYQMVGVLFANGSAPKSRIKYWFKLLSEHPLLGSDLVSRAMEKRVTVIDRTIRGLCQWWHFHCQYFTLTNFWEGQPTFESKDMWHLGAREVGGD